MRNNWLFLPDFDGGSPYIFPADQFVSHGLGGHIFSQITSFVDSSFYQSGYLHVPGSVALQEAFNCISKFAGALLFWFSSGPSSNISHNSLGNSHGSRPGSCKSSTQIKHITSRGHYFTRFRFSSRSKGKSFSPVTFGMISSSMLGNLFREVGKFESLPVLSLAAALIPPFRNLSPDVLAAPLENKDTQMCGCIDQMLCEVEDQGCNGFSLSDLIWTRHAVEPRTGIEFPVILDNIVSGEDNSSLTSEILVGTGSRTMTIVKIKSLKVYAFGFYIHPYSVCEKLGPKYASIPVGELNKRRDFYEDLLREDINMTVRLVVNCNGMKINTVRDAFEKSLGARLLKMNPETDYNCLRRFSSCFRQDIPLPAGTTIYFRQTADGQLITEIGGNQIGAVHSKDLCRAFFDMYIGDVPVSEQTKEEIGRNVASILGRC